MQSHNWTMSKNEAWEWEVVVVLWKVRKSNRGREEKEWKCANSH